MARIKNVHEMPICFTKGELVEMLGTTRDTLRKMLNKNVVEKYLGISYEDWEQLRIIPPNIASRIKKYFAFGIFPPPIPGTTYLNLQLNQKFTILTNDTVREVAKCSWEGNEIEVTFKDLASPVYKLDYSCIKYQEQQKIKPGN
jgi:hypothetical protein